jgi:hypothetical protein
VPIALLSAAFTLAERQKFFVLRQRLELCDEFAQAVARRGHGTGVLFSGPNGVGKSAIGLLTHMVCASRGLLTAYIPTAKSWVAAAERGEGDTFLLEMLWQQNADLIAASDALRPVFKAALHDGDAPFTEATMKELRTALNAPGSPGVGIIVDEVQAITQAVAQRAAANATSREREAAAYFVSRWHDWDNENRVFARMSIASSHGARELKLPDGEERRLRIVEPLNALDIEAVQTAASSPAYIVDPGLRKHVTFIAGGILRRLVRGAELSRGRGNSKAVRRHIWHTLWVPMMESCSRWLASMPAGGEDRKAAVDNVLALVRGELVWGRAKPLFDDGLVARTVDSPLVAPVSSVAAAVILQVVAAERRGWRISLRSVQEGAERGYELERQVRDALNPCHVFVPTKLLDGTATAGLPLHASYALPFTQLGDVVARDDPVAYIPTDGNYACDAIVMPAKEDARSPIIVVESSVTDPLQSKRVSKVRSWFAADGFASQLQAAHPTRRIVCALVWDQVLGSRAVNGNVKALSNGAASAESVGDNFVVLDQLALVRLGISV